MLKTILLDDEPLPLKLLAVYASKLPQLQIVGEFNNPIEAVQFLESHDVDLMFLDIEMPHLNGLDLLKNLKQKPMTIFTTAYPEFAVSGFELNAIDYLLKPCDFERFKTAVQKAEEYHNFLTNQQKTPKEAFIFVKSEYKAVKINLADIIYIEGMDSYVKIYAGGRPVLSLMSMKSMTELLPADQFVRVHRSFIIPISKIKQIASKHILVGEKEIPVGGTYEGIIEQLKRDHSLG